MTICLELCVQLIRRELLILLDTVFMTVGSLLIRQYTSEDLRVSDQRTATAMFCLVAWLAVFVCWA